MAYKQQKFYENRMLFVDTTFFDVFDFKLLAGNKAMALHDPYSVLVSEKMAKKYFGDADPLNEVLEYQNEIQLKVTGILQNPPSNSHIQYDFIVPSSLYQTINPIHEGMTSWNALAFTYLLLQSESARDALEQKLPDFTMQTLKPYYHDAEKHHFFLFLLTKLHLWSEYPHDIAPPGNIRYVYLLGAIALLVLFIACINYINMATAHATKRGMEVGLRKTVGAARYQLFSQFMVEAVCLVGFALVLGLVIAGSFLPYFNFLTDKTLSISLGTPFFWLGSFVLVIFVSVLSGAYPAVFLSRFRPVSIFQKTTYSTKDYGLRRLLVVFQFFISYTLIIVTIILNNQLNYTQNVNLGFEKENVAVLPVEGKIGNQLPAFQNTLLNQPGVLEVSAAASMPAKEDLWMASMEKIEGLEGEKLPRLNLFQIDGAFFSLMKMELVAGRFFSDSLASDSTEAVIINETAARQLGWYAGDSLTALGKYMKPFGDQPKRYVIGVVKDFHFQSMKSTIGPAIFRLLLPGQEEYISHIPVKISGTNVPNTLKNIQKTWQKFIPEHPFGYSFLDEDFDRLYKKEEKVAATFTYFSIIAIGLSFLGIIGLTTFVTLQRTKEIGVRKVLGASVPGILLLLSKDHLKLIFVAFIIAIPVANYFITEWLKEFAYKIEIQWWMFALPGLMVMIIALLSVSSQTLKAARANPVESLRNE